MLRVHGIFHITDYFTHSDIMFSIVSEFIFDSLENGTIFSFANKVFVICKRYSSVFVLAILSAFVATIVNGIFFSKIHSYIY